MQALFLLNPSSGYSRTKSDYVSDPGPHSTFRSTVPSGRSNQISGAPEVPLDQKTNR